MADIRSLAKWTLDALWSLRPNQLKPRIIYYHSVHPEAPYSHRPAQFDAQLAWLRKAGYRSLTMREVCAGMYDPSKSPDAKWVAITFDDGYLDNFTHALPILQEHGFVATFFVIAGLVRQGTPACSSEGKNLYPSRQMLTPKALGQMAAAGMEIGSHGLTHQLATAIAARSLDELEEELRQSINLLSSFTGEPVDSYAYPNGQIGSFDRTTIELTRRLRFKSASTTLWGPVGSRPDSQTLPRCEMNCDDTLGEFSAKMTGKRDYRYLIHRARKGANLWSPIEQS